MSNPSSNLRPLGAIPVRNAKGELTMQKVKVHRYVSGRKPKYAENASSSESEDSGAEIEMRRKLIVSHMAKDRNAMAFTLNKNQSESIFSSDSDANEDDEEDDLRMKMNKDKDVQTTLDQTNVMDRRMHRLMQFKQAEDNTRKVFKPEIIESSTRDRDDSEDGETLRPHRHREVIDAEAYDDSDDEDHNVERRHEVLRQARLVRDDTHLDQEQDEEESDYDEEDDEEDEEEEDMGVPRLKPVFVPKNKRNTILEKEIEEETRLQKIEAEKMRAAEDRRRETWKLIEEERRAEEEEEAKAKVQAEEEALIRGIASVLTDDEEEEVAFELWKVRELRRIKRDRDEEEAREKELREIERLRNMTEEERQAELAANPRKITNESKKGKYKFMQKYFHRGVFYLDKEEDVLKRDFAQPTLEDHFDKSSLPSVMQVKNFGRSGRTKYTHLVDQDTTKHDSAWSAKDNTHAVKFHQQHGGGMKQGFERPAKKK